MSLILLCFDFGMVSALYPYESEDYMKNAILRISTKINGTWQVKKTPVNSIEQAVNLVKGLTITEFTSVVQDDTGFLFEIMPNGRVAPIQKESMRMVFVTSRKEMLACGWCENKHEDCKPTALGLLCPRCERGIESRGEKL